MDHGVHLVLITRSVLNTAQTRTAMCSCRDPETAVIHFWSSGVIRHRPQRAVSAAAAVIGAATVCRQGGRL